MWSDSWRYSPPPPKSDAKPNGWATLKAKVTAVTGVAVKKAKAACSTTTGTAKLLCAVLPLKRIAAGVGLVSLVCPPVESAIGGAVATVAVQVTTTLRRVAQLASAAR